nr:MAG TPA: hypothetical protein [Caudoviricetes sp.]
MCGKISKAHRCDQCDRVCGLFIIISDLSGLVLF